MQKDFSEKKLLSMSTEKQFKALYDLARFIEVNKHLFKSTHFEKLKKYHLFLQESEHDKIQKLNKEFKKITSTDYQFQVYLMNLERFLGQSKKDYDFIVNTGDSGEKPKEAFPIICLLDSIRSAHNVGSIFRNSECFNINEIILCGLTPTPKSAQVQKTAMGCDESVKWSYEKSATEEVKKLKSNGHTIWAVETSNQALNINELKSIPTPLVLIFGHEVHGISHELLELSDEIVSIPLHGSKNSLNVSVCNAIVLQSLVSSINT